MEIGLVGFMEQNKELTEIVEEVRRKYPKIQIRNVFIRRYPDRKTYEFHYKDFVWKGLAKGKFDARFKGWTEFLKR